MSVTQHSDEELRRIYTNGECPAFALALVTMLKADGIDCTMQAVVDEGELWTDADGEEYPTPFHVFVYLCDGDFCVDALGQRSQQAIVDAYVWDMAESPRIEDFSPEELAHHCGFEDQPFYPIGKDDLELANQAIVQLGIVQLVTASAEV